jgi:DNA-directed RNA polymerase subunit E'
MYYLATLKDTLRVPPTRFDEDLREILLELARAAFEEQIDPELGFIVAVLAAEEVGMGKILQGDGGAFYEGTFKILCYLPTDGEIVEGECTETTDFGLFVRISTIDALCHVSQITDDFFSYSANSGVLQGRKSGRKLSVGDRVRGKVIAVGIGNNNIRVGITMRQAGLGAIEWIDKWKEENEERRKKQKTGEVAEEII